MKLKDKIAVITGSSRGIGKSIAKEFAIEGAKVVINYKQNKSDALKVSNSITANGGDCMVIQADVSIYKDVKSLVDETLKKFGRVDILVNNASITLRSNLFDITEKIWNQVLETNLKGTFFCSQLFGEYLLKEHCGCIINIASTAAFLPKPYSHHYVASKTGIIGLTKSLAISLAPYVRVNCVAPGVVKTEKWENRSVRQLEKTIKKIPLGRLATMNEIAKTVVFLASEGTYITGQTIIVDGGLCLQNLTVQ